METIQFILELIPYAFCIAVGYISALHKEAVNGRIDKAVSEAIKLRKETLKGYKKAEQAGSGVGIKLR